MFLASSLALPKSAKYFREGVVVAQAVTLPPITLCFPLCSVTVSGI